MAERTETGRMTSPWARAMAQGSEQSGRSRKMMKEWRLGRGPRQRAQTRQCGCHFFPQAVRILPDPRESEHPPHSPECVDDGL